MLAPNTNLSVSKGAIEMPIRKISHIGIAVRDLEEQKKLYGGVLGLELVAEEEVDDQKVRVAMYRVGESRVELLEPTAPDSPIARFLDKRGEGIHHVAYEVDDVRPMLGRIKGEGVRLIDEEPRPGAEGQNIAFLHPKSTFGVLTELCQPGDSEDSNCQ
jgi:methylmalonyl-CoA/ethylmalonyl-CoA epimerase